MESSRLQPPIISLIDFRSAEPIGKSAQQIKAYADFIFNQSAQMKEALAESIKTQQEFKLVEKIVAGKSCFQFFPPKPQRIDSSATVSLQEADKEKPNATQKTV